MRAGRPARSALLARFKVRTVNKGEDESGFVAEEAGSGVEAEAGRAEEAGGRKEAVETGWEVAGRGGGLQLVLVAILTII
jgi:hypothetical protein